jgi:DNA-binding transcriptional regulator YhcF (GntR family)
VIGVDPASVVPPYEQIRAQVAEQARDGRLPPGTRLPTVRRLATDLGLAVNTVARAYRELERDGVVLTRGRNGTFVTTATDPTTRAGEEAAVAYVRRVRRLGISPDLAVRLVRDALGAPAGRSEPEPEPADGPPAPPDLAEAGTGSPAGRPG